VLGRPLEVSAVAEASLRGAAVHVRERLGEPVGEAPIAGTVLPRFERTRLYRAARARQRDLYEGVT
jgi:uncharacterized membrane protein